ncbi:MAG: DUF4255 domain-containing protein [Cyanobacteria bacterium CRU_2_1]|nr:DUF4255 domain-containing protein [Cyanobacteria bacterium RU_5_0]NJR57862.1 DUF4255 domain-containing protein [Cyanobacteria bacterium CRU_2_1]
MIQDLDETIRQLLIQHVPINETVIDIQFDRPNQNWESRLTKPTINCFLYDIRENLSLRFDQQRYLTRNTPANNEEKATGIERVAPVRMDFTYLITTWTRSEETRVLEEHMLLGNILRTLLRFPILSSEMLRGELVNQPLPVRTWVAQPEDMPKTWEFWGANEWRLKAGLSYRVTLAVEPVLPEGVELVTETILRMQLTS